MISNLGIKLGQVLNHLVLRGCRVHITELRLQKPHHVGWIFSWYEKATQLSNCMPPFAPLNRSKICSLMSSSFISPDSELELNWFKIHEHTFDNSIWLLKYGILDQWPTFQLLKITYLAGKFKSSTFYFRNG